MSDNLILQTQRAGDGRTLALINGKLFTLLAGYQDPRAEGWFFLAVAGQTPLRPDDLAQHWQVVRSGPVTLALAQRPFSYHLARGDDAEPPYGCDWPHLKTPPRLLRLRRTQPGGRHRPGPPGAGAVPARPGRPLRDRAPLGGPRARRNRAWARRAAHPPVTPEGRHPAPLP
jgi:hypothetical protein